MHYIYISLEYAICKNICGSRLISMISYNRTKVRIYKFAHFGDSLRTPVAPLMSPSPVCLSAEGAKNVSGP